MQHRTCGPAVLAAVLMLSGCERAPLSPESDPAELLRAHRAPSGSVTQLTAADGAAFDFFGAAVSIHEGLAIVGSPFDDDGRVAAGSAYVYRRTGTGWTEEAKLTAGDSLARNLGSAVSVHDGLAILGAPRNGVPSLVGGSAYVFRRTGTSWIQEAKLTPRDTASPTYFGWSVSIHDELAIVGDWLDDDVRSDAGAAYVFRRTQTGWIQEAKLTASDSVASAYFGEAVSIHDGLAIVGAAGGSALTGAAYVFRRTETGWIQEAKLTASDATTFDYFGTAVSIHDGLAIVGATRGAHASPGAAYVFRRTGTDWTQVAKLTASDGVASDYFGDAVSIHDELAIVGAPSSSDGGLRSGAAYVFRGMGTCWTQVAKLTATDAAASDDFGDAVSIHAGVAIVGAPQDDVGGLDVGSAYVFTRGDEWSEEDDDRGGKEKFESAARGQCPRRESNSHGVAPGGF